MHPEFTPDETAAPTGAIVVSAAEDRWGNTTRVSPDRVWTKVSRMDTDGAWSLFESLVPSGLAVPLHLHREQDEWFWVLDGTFVFEVGGEMYHLSSGMSLLAPRRIPHRWKKTPDGEGRLLIVAQPADRLEEFFERFAALSLEQEQDLPRLEILFSECGMDLLGPPLDFAAVKSS